MLRLLFAILIVAAPATAAADPPAWDVEPENSRLGFVTSWQAAPIKGEFKVWRADIQFDPDDLAASSVRVEIETGSADTKYADRDTAIKGPEWFAIKAFPLAVFETETIKHVDGDAYEATGNLTVKGVTQPVVLSFTLALQNGHAIMSGEASVSRLEFNVGEGQWRQTNFIKDEVLIEIALQANRRG